MKKLIGLKNTKTAIFISGTGSNLKNLIKFSKKKKSPISIDKNSVHGSDSIENAKIEIDFFFED